MNTGVTRQWNSSLSLLPNCIQCTSQFNRYVISDSRMQELCYYALDLVCTKVYVSGHCNTYHHIFCERKNKENLNWVYCKTLYCLFIQLSPSPSFIYCCQLITNRLQPRLDCPKFSDVLSSNGIGVVFSFACQSLPGSLGLHVLTSH